MHTTPASAEQNPLKAYTLICVAATGSPISRAEASLPPSAYTQRPKRVQCASHMPSATVTSAISAPIDSEAPAPIGTRNWAMATYSASSIGIESTLIR